MWNQQPDCSLYGGLVFDLAICELKEHDVVHDAECPSSVQELLKPHWTQPQKGIIVFSIFMREYTGNREGIAEAFRTLLNHEQWISKSLPLSQFYVSRKIDKTCPFMSHLSQSLCSVSMWSRRDSTCCCSSSLSPSLSAILSLNATTSSALHIWRCWNRAVSKSDWVLSVTSGQWMNVNVVNEWM